MEEQKMDVEFVANDIEIEGLTEQEAKQIKAILERFIDAYKKSGEEQEKFTWLDEQLRIELPHKSEDEVKDIKEDIISAIQEYEEDLISLKKSTEQGETKEKWFADRMEEGAKGVAVNAYGEYLNQVSKTIKASNQQMQGFLSRKAGGCSQHINLDGLIAEQFHVNSFNAKAEQLNSPLRASYRSTTTSEGQFCDILIFDHKRLLVVDEYQVAYGKTPEITKQILKRVPYGGQKWLVPADFAEEIQKSTEGVSVVDHLGGTETANITSEALSKEDARKLQVLVQDSADVPRTDWNIYSMRKLAINLGKQAGVAGVQAAFLATGVNLVGKVVNGEEIACDEVVKTALEVGADTGIKAAAGGALVVAAESGLLPIIPEGTAPGTLVKIACVGIENIKIAIKLAKGELTVNEALEKMGKTSTAMYVGLSAAGVGTTLGAAMFWWIPIAGPIVGGLIGGMVGYAAGSKIGEAVFNGAKKIAEIGERALEKTWEDIKSVGRGIKEFISS